MQTPEAPKGIFNRLSNFDLLGKTSRTLYLANYLAAAVTFFPCLVGDESSAAFNYLKTRVTEEKFKQSPISTTAIAVATIPGAYVGKVGASLTKPLIDGAVRGLHKIL